MPLPNIRSDAETVVAGEKVCAETRPCTAEFRWPLDRLQCSR